MLGLERDCIKNEFKFAKNEVNKLAENIGNAHGHKNPKQKIKYFKDISLMNAKLKFVSLF